MPRRRKYTPQEREELAREDYHDPTAGIGGAPPARSALTLRLILATFGLLVCATGAALFLILVSQPVVAGIWAFLAAVALADIVAVEILQICRCYRVVLTRPGG